MPNTIMKMSGLPSPQVRHIYRNRTGGLISTYSTTDGICYRCVSSVTNAIPPPDPPGPTGPGQPALQIRLFPNTAVGTFSWFPMPGGATGLVDYGNGTLVPWEQDPMSLTFSGSVPANGVVSIYSDKMTLLSLNTQPIRSITIVNAPPIFTQLACTDNKLVGCVDLRNATSLTNVDFAGNYINGVLFPSPSVMSYVFLNNNLISQANAESIALQLMSSSLTSGYLNLVIRSQRNGVFINITTTPFLNLISKGWNVS